MLSLPRHSPFVQHPVQSTCDTLDRRLSASESALMDPQGRVLLEQAGLALADAGARLGEPVGARTGVYVGVMHMEYIQLLTGAASHCGSTPCPTIFPLPSSLHN